MEEEQLYRRKSCKFTAQRASLERKPSINQVRGARTSCETSRQRPGGLPLELLQFSPASAGLRRRAVYLPRESPQQLAPVQVLVPCVRLRVVVLGVGCRRGSRGRRPRPRGRGQQWGEGERDSGSRADEMRRRRRRTLARGGVASPRRRRTGRSDKSSREPDATRSGLILVLVGLQKH